MKYLHEIKDWKEAINCVVQGDSLDLLKMIPDNAIDLYS
jgi:DNA modification methylase